MIAFMKVKYTFITQAEIKQTYVSEFMIVVG